MDSLTGGLLGVLLGMRHALEADHLTAVSTLVAEQRSARKGAVLGVFWGIGHSVAIFAVGLALILLRRDLPARLAQAFELGVAIMLIALGGRALLRSRIATEPHHHGGMASRPLGIGLVHGLAGSGALTALVVARLPGIRAQLSYLLLFGLGSIAGMAMLSGLIGWPLARVSRHPGAARLIASASGVLAAGLGVAWAWPILSRWLG
jgi:hypothetical protein